MKTAHALRTLAHALVAATAVALPALPASAQDGVWKRTGDGYAISFASLDLSQPGDRQAVLQTLTRASKRICISRHTPMVLVRSCQREVMAETLANASPAFQEAVQLALTEGKGVQQAMR